MKRLLMKRLIAGLSLSLLLLSAGSATSIAPSGVGNPPYRQPHLAAGNGLVALTFAAGGAIMISISRDGGATFGIPRRVSEWPVLAAGRHRGPRAMFVGRELLVSAVVGKMLQTGEHAHGLPSDGDLVVWRSSDEGRTWSKPIVVNDAPGAAREGFQAIAWDGHRELAAVWLDLRKTGTRLYGAFSSDLGATWSKNVLVYEAPEGTLCPCCGPSLAATGPGEFAAMFRNVIGESRDLYTVRLSHGRVRPGITKVGAGSWNIKGCPMDGGGLLYSNGRLISAWRRESDVYVDVGGQPETRIGTGVDVSLAESAGAPWVAWQTAGQVLAWHAGKTEVVAAANGGFPEMVGLPGGGVVVAWEDSGKISTKLLGRSGR